MFFWPQPYEENKEKNGVKSPLPVAGITKKSYLLT
jgi:hypothetical protein